LLEVGISLRTGDHRLKDYRVKNRSLPVERRSDEHAVQDGRSLEPQIRDRFQRSVYEGELPGNRLEPSSAVWEW